MAQAFKLTVMEYSPDGLNVFIHDTVPVIGRNVPDILLAADRCQLTKNNILGFVKHPFGNFFIKPSCNIANIDNVCGMSGFLRTMLDVFLP